MLSSEPVGLNVGGTPVPLGKKRKKLLKEAEFYQLRGLISLLSAPEPSSAQSPRDQELSRRALIQATKAAIVAKSQNNYENVKRGMINACRRAAEMGQAAATYSELYPASDMLQIVHLWEMWHRRSDMLGCL